MNGPGREGGEGEVVDEGTCTAAQPMITLVARVKRDKGEKAGEQRSSAIHENLTGGVTALTGGFWEGRVGLEQRYFFSLFWAAGSSYPGVLSGMLERV